MGYLFGGNTGQTAESLAEARQRMAMAMLQNGADTSPIRSGWQGAARLADALMGGLDIRAQTAAQNASNTELEGIMGGDYGGTDTPYKAPSMLDGLKSMFGGGSPAPATASQQASADQAASGHPAPGVFPSVPGKTYDTAPDDVKSMIAQNVPAALQPYVTNMVGHESKYDTNAVSPTGATGLAQFTRGTGADYGLVGKGFDNRKDPTANIKAMVALTQANQNGLRNALGREPTDGELALAHQQGLGGALTLLRGGNADAGNLAANNVHGNGQAAANKIMSFYGYGQGGQSPAVAAIDAQTGNGPAPTGYIDPMVSAQNSTPGIPPQSPTPVPVDPNQQTGRLPMGPAAQQVMNDRMGGPVPGDPNAAPVQLGAPQPGQLGPGVPPNADGSAPPMSPPVNVGANPVPPGSPQQALAQSMPQQPPVDSQAVTGAVPGDKASALAQAAAPALSQPQGLSPRGRALMHVMMNPYASSQAREMAGGLLQQEMAPQIDYQTRPDGSIIGINKRTGQVQQVQGPMKTNGFVDGPTDPNTGIAPKLYGNSVDGYKVVSLGADGSMQLGAPVQMGGAQAPAAAGGQPGPAGSTQQPEMPVGDVKTYRERRATLAADEAHPTAKQELDFGNGVTERQSYKEYSMAIPTWNSFTQHIQDNSPAADKAIVDDFAKILNPGRSVTTGAFQLNMDAQSIPAEMQATILKAFSGDGELGPDARAQMARIAQIKMGEYKNAWGVDSGQATKLAKAHHLNVDNVIPQVPDLADIDFSKINSVKTDRTGTTPYAAAPAGPVQIKSVDDYDNLPAGTHYIDPNGVARTKN